MRLRKCGIVSELREALGGFNEAAAVRLRKLVCGSTVGAAANLLQ